MRFDLPYGPDHDSTIREELAEGTYWVKAKFPSGEQVQELFEVPVGAQHHLISIKLSDEPLVGTTLSTIDESSGLGASTGDYPHNLFPKLEYLAEDAKVFQHWSTIGQSDTSAGELALPVPKPPPSSPSSTRSTKMRGGATEGNGARRKPVSRGTIGAPIVIAPSRTGEERRAQPAIALASNVPRVEGYSVDIVQSEYAKWPAFIEGISIKRYFGAVFLISPTKRVAALVQNNELIVELERGTFDRHFGRRFAVVDGEQDGGRTLVSVPAGFGARSVRIAIAPPQLGEQVPSITIEVENPAYNSLLQFLRQNDLRAAVRVLDSAEELLYAKADDPVAAAAAGYALLNAPPNAIRVPWHYWIGNLGAYFDYVPDGRILHATLLLQRSDVYGEKRGNFDSYFPDDLSERLLKAASLIESSLEMGPPMFRMGLGLTASNIGILLESDLPKDVLAKMRRADKLVTALRRRVNPLEPFCVFHLENDDV
ncbi:hypothetical protein [Massilia eburnea]|uniref:hypothetical protein n=1 Tax=Massilia eburnea TaxID=1776165 RepID=UPI001BADF53D|nr:hypothetical protein [Massilia eburnea]